MVPLHSRIGRSWYCDLGIGSGGCFELLQLVEEEPEFLIHFDYASYRVLPSNTNAIAVSFDLHSRCDVVGYSSRSKAWVAPDFGESAVNLLTVTMPSQWNVRFLQTNDVNTSRALIILNQPFSVPLLLRLWQSCTWRACADGGANRLHDAFQDDASRTRFVFVYDLFEEDIPTTLSRYLPDLIKGDLDSLRADVRDFYTTHVRILLRSEPRCPSN